MKRMKIVLSITVVILIICGIIWMGQDKSYIYTGENWKKYEGYKIDIVVLDTSVARTTSLGKSIIENGNFKISGAIEHPQNAYFGLYNPEGDFEYKAEFVAESGNLTLTLNGKNNKLEISGGVYNPIFNAINSDPVALKKQRAVADFTSNLKREDYEKDEIKNKYDDLSSDANSYVLNQYNDLRFKHQDPYVRLLAISHSDRKKDFETELIALEKELGSVPEIVTLRYSAKQAKEYKTNNNSIGVGSIIKDFSSKNLNDEEFRLSDVLKDNKYVLVEFWASWCGPCRSEIPHMKEAYNAHHKNGFEIVSFTLDHDRDRWERASEKEALPWINVGDLLAYNSPVVKMYGFRGIPANYLVDQTGTIIAKDLRQDALDEKLEELLN